MYFSIVYLVNENLSLVYYKKGKEKYLGCDKVGESINLMTGLVSKYIALRIKFKNIRPFTL